MNVEEKDHFVLQIAYLVITWIILGVIVGLVFLGYIPHAKLPPIDISSCNSFYDPNDPQHTIYYNCINPIYEQNRLILQANTNTALVWFVVFMLLLTGALFLCIVLLPRLWRLAQRQNEIVSTLVIVGLVIIAALFIILGFEYTSEFFFGIGALFSFLLLGVALTHPTQTAKSQEIKPIIEAVPELQGKSERVDVLERGMELERQGKHKEALLLLREAVKRDDQSYIAWTYLAGALSGLGEHTEALTAADYALQINPHYALAWTAKGFAFNNQGDEDAAIAACNKALAIEPNNTYTLYIKGLALTFKGELDVALATFDRALKINPTYLNALFGKGVIFSELERPQELLPIAEKMIRIDPEDTRAWRLKGKAYSLRHDYHEAISAIDQAIQLEPNDASIWFLKGEVYAEAQAYGEALDALNKALTINPNDAEARELKANILAMRRSHATGAAGEFGLRLGVGLGEGLAKVFVGMVKAIFKDWSKL